MITTTDSFTKELFASLRLEWDEYAKARETLDSIFPEDESIISLFQDVVFSLSRFFHFIDDNSILTYYTFDIETNRLSFGLQMQLSEKHYPNQIFSVVNSKNGYSFTDAIGTDVHINCLDELQMFLLCWFNDFYERYEGNCAEQ
jgi:hypothetical protein